MAKTINIQFRLPESYAGELSDYAMGYESQAQTAKRLLMEFLDGKHSQESEPPQAVPAPIPSDLGDLGDRLSALEKSLVNPVIPDDIGDRLEKICRNGDQKLLAYLIFVASEGVGMLVAEVKQHSHRNRYQEHY